MQLLPSDLNRSLAVNIATVIAICCANAISRAAVAGFVFVVSLPAMALEYTEAREPCAGREPLMQPLFGDLHVHTRYSLDASTQGTRTTPVQAYEFALGKAIGIQPWDETNKPRRALQLRRPLDFAMVSDHAELIGEVHMCNTPGVQGYDAWQCKLYRNWPRGAYYLFNYMSSMRASHLGLCGDDDKLCDQAALEPWQEMREAAEKFYDRSADCSFTTFVGYEWTGMEADSGGNLHRNVVFRNDQVPPLPISFIDAPGAQRLWASLDRQCHHTDTGCDALVIPHNSNISAGFMFSALKDDGSPMDADYASMRQRYEPLAEIMQHKGASECFQSAAGGEDELCAFEQQPVDNIAGFGTLPRANTGFLRQVLVDGLALEQELGTNPYKLGFIGSTDTHLGTPGAVDEDRFLGHGGAGVPARKSVPQGLPDKLEYNPGGLAVLWAEENSRDALFAAMRRREAYGTSGPRIVSRMFAGWNLSPGLCTAPDRVARAYASGVPMGADLPPSPGVNARPSILVAASADVGVDESPGMPLQRIQIIKGWLDAEGDQHQRVFDVAGDANNGASVDPLSCEPRGAGARQLCAVWTDPDFDPGQRAFYYSRVLENPSCRWSQRMCVTAGVDCGKPETVTEGFAACCAAEHRPVIQERAWSSPIWYTPGAGGSAN